jgi:alpha-tubulin suppressor-like RCC1 family protein
MRARSLLVITAVVALGGAACTTAGTAAEPGGPPIAVRDVDAGFRFACAADRDGQVWCWGDGASGKLGNNSTAEHNVPQQVTGIDDAVQVTTGDNHACALRESGSVWCWGDNTWGQLGDNTYVAKAVPVETRGLIDATSIAAGAGFTCATRQNQRVVCWGDHRWGQLGAGILWLFATNSPTPLLLPDILDGVEISAGNFHACVERADGTAWCWGANEDGQLGDGTLKNRNKPVRVSGLTGVTDLAGGRRSSCAVSGSAVQCWGDDAHSQIGGNGNSLVPVPIAGLPSVSAVETGVDHACAVTSAQQLMCWGEGYSGQLGNGQDGTGTESGTPVINGLSGVTSAGLGWLSSCAATADGYLSCWGLNTTGQLGNGTNQFNATTPVHVVEEFQPPADP